MLRLENEGFADSASGAGLVSRAGAFRFRDEEGRVDRSGDGIEVAVVAGEGSDGSACLADARVTLEDMSMYSICNVLLLCRLISNELWS